MLIPEQISAQLGVVCTYDITNHFLRIKPAARFKTPIEAIVIIVLKDPVFEYFFRISEVSNPESTIRGILPSITTPNIGLAISREPKRFSFERILKTRKNRMATIVFRMLLWIARYMSAEIK